MPQQPSFSSIQYEFAQAIRNPDQNPIPDNINPRRMAIYQDLFYNNIEGFVSNAFPVIREITDDESWSAMIRDFMIQHHCKTPLFHEIVREYLNYLDNERDNKDDPVFLKELAHYEWVELALSVLEDDTQPLQLLENEDLMQLQLSTMSTAWSLSYHYPVHQIGPDFQPDEISDHPIFLLVYRNMAYGVTFLDLNPVSARLIDLLNQGLTVQSASSQISQELQHPAPKVVDEGAKSLIYDWISRGVLKRNN